MNLIPRRTYDRLIHLITMHVSVAILYRGSLQLGDVTQGIPGEVTETIELNRDTDIRHAVDAVDRVQSMVSGCLDEILQLLGTIPDVRGTDSYEYVREATDTQDIDYRPGASVEENYASTYAAARLYGGIPTMIHQYVEKETP